MGVQIKPIRISRSLLLFINTCQNSDQWPTRRQNCNSLHFAWRRSMHSSWGRVFSKYQKCLHSLEQILLGSLYNIVHDSSAYTIYQNRTNLKKIGLQMFALTWPPWRWQNSTISSCLMDAYLTNNTSTFFVSSYVLCSEVLSHPKIFN